jgi:hypothetical protein
MLAPFFFVWRVFSNLAPFALTAIFLGYLLPHAIVSIFFTSRDLKEAYNAEWALVTGASSGKCKGVYMLKEREFTCSIARVGRSPTFFYSIVTGIGKALARRLAQQNLNIVLVALDDPLLDETYNEMKSNFPKVTVRKVCIQPDR